MNWSYCRPSHHARLSKLITPTARNAQQWSEWHSWESASLPIKTALGSNNRILNCCTLNPKSMPTFNLNTRVYVRICMGWAKIDLAPWPSWSIVLSTRVLISTSVPEHLIILLFKGEIKQIYEYYSAKELFFFVSPQCEWDFCDCVGNYLWASQYCCEKLKFYIVTC